MSRGREKVRQSLSGRSRTGMHCWVCSWRKICTRYSWNAL